MCSRTCELPKGASSTARRSDARTKVGLAEPEGIDCLQRFDLVEGAVLQLQLLVDQIEGQIVGRLEANGAASGMRP